MGCQNLSAFQVMALNDYVDKNLKLGRIRPSTSNYSSRVALLNKPNSTEYRVVQDYRAVNAAMVSDNTQLMAVNQFHSNVEGSKFFTVLDISEAFYSIELEESSRKYTAFSTPKGLFEFCVAPMGIKNSPAALIAALNNIFSDLIYRNLIIFVDDFLIFTKTEAEHDEILNEVVKRLKENNLFCSPKKFQYKQKEVEFCGFLYSEKGIAIKESQVAGIIDKPAPTNVKEMRAFLGAVQYFSEHIKHFAEITRPLSNLTKLVLPWVWREAEEQAFKDIKEAMMSTDVLRYFNPKLKTELHTDASDYAMGACLMQIDNNDVRRPVAYWSKILDPAQRNYTVHNKELLAIAESVKKFGWYLQGTKFKVLTDHKPLVVINKQEKLNPQQIRAIEFLQQFDMEIEYLPGLDNTLADWLSRALKYKGFVCPFCKENIDNEDPESVMSESLSVNSIKIGNVCCDHDNSIEFDYSLDDSYEIHVDSIQSTRIVQVDGINKEVLISPTVQLNRTLVNKIEAHNTIRNKKWVVPTELVEEVLKEYHQNELYNHPGPFKMLKNLSNYTWRGMSNNIRDYCKRCHLCQISKAKTSKRNGHLISTKLPVTPFDSIGIDFFYMKQNEHEGNSSGFAALIIDRLTRLIKIIPCDVTITSVQFWKLFLKHWVLQGKGYPKEVIRDLDPRFTSNFWKEIAKKHEITLKYATKDHH